MSRHPVISRDETESTNDEIFPDVRVFVEREKNGGRWYIVKPDRIEFNDCWKTTWETPYIMRLALLAGIGGLLFGYNTGAIFGAAIGGWMNNRFGRKLSVLVADVLFFVGVIVMALAPAPWMIIVGRVFVGLGVGMASMTAPLYISEASPARNRGALVSTNGLLITGGQFFSYLINLAFTHASGTWRWMLGVAGLPAMVQFFFMLSLPESPRWLYRRIYPADEVKAELTALKNSIEAEKADEKAIGYNLIAKLKGALGNVVVRRGLYAGVTVQVAQQFSGINTVMYYSPTIVQLAGFASNKTALALSLITSGLNAAGSIVSMAFVDRYGRRRMMIISMFGIITCLVILSAVFFQAASHAPKISQFESTHFAANGTCPGYVSGPNPTSWNCMSCLNADCGFCSNEANEVSCPSRIGFLAVIFLGLYIISFSPGMETVPWIVNSEIYPLKYRGLGGGIAAVCNWTSNLIVSLTSLTLTKALGSSGTFLLFAGYCVIGLIFIYWFVPETKGLHFEEVEMILRSGFKPSAFKSKSKNYSQST
ncbi:putative inositol transporter 3 [Hibiscus syriacus]|uniref:Inositol transporter 3 n=1 Tax=Hibiscus syriacus TaxID=106335 RepID=A0A6A2Z3W3_HIBSY|nr:putative inositol transporter 3 [Hibiscus syriacus]